MSNQQSSCYGIESFERQTPASVSEYLDTILLYDVKYLKKHLDRCLELHLGSTSQLPMNFDAEKQSRNNWFGEKLNGAMPTVPLFLRLRKIGPLTNVVQSTLHKSQCDGLSVNQVKAPKKPSNISYIDLPHKESYEKKLESRKPVSQRLSLSLSSLGSIGFDKVECDLLPRSLPETPYLPKIYGFDRYGQEIDEEFLPVIQYVIPNSEHKWSYLENFKIYFDQLQLSCKARHNIKSSQNRVNQTGPTSERETINDFSKEISNKDYKNKMDREEAQKKKMFKPRIRRKIENGSYSNCSVDENNLPKLLRYVWKGKLTKLKKYLSVTKKHHKINITDHQGRTALHYASSWACASTVKELLKIQNINVNAQDKDFKTPLFKAVEIGDLPTIQVLVKAGAKIGISAKDGRNVFEYALQDHGDKYLKIIKYLYKEGEMRQKGKGRLSYLHLLCLTKKNVEAAEVMQYLINEREFVDATEGKGRTPLMFAAQRNKVELVNILLDHSADAKHIDANLKSVLRYADTKSECYKVLHRHLQELQRLAAKPNIPQEDKVKSIVTSSTLRQKTTKTKNTGYITRLF